MTIAAGFVCRDGVVMCADSQESCGDYKWPVNKLALSYSLLSNVPIMMAGAGFAPAIDAATQKIQSALIGVSSHDGVLAKIQSVLREIYETDLSIYQIDSRDSLNFELLISFCVKGDVPRLYHTVGSLITFIPNFSVIGSGLVVNTFAHTLYRKTTWNAPLLYLSHGKVLAAYLANLAKKQLSSIGGQTQICAIDDKGNISVADSWELPIWDECFSVFESLSGELMFTFADPMHPEEDLRESLRLFNSKVRQMGSPQEFGKTFKYR